MEPRVTPAELQAIEREAAEFLQRSVKRAERAGGIGCAISFVVLGLAAITAPLHGGVAFFFAAFATMIILAVATNKARKASVDDFRATFSSLANAGVRRDLAAAYLKRQIAAHGKTKPGRIAGEIVASLGRLQAAGPELRRDLAEGLRGIEPRVVVEGLPRERGSSSAEDPNGPIRTRVEIELPDPDGPRTKRVREEVREARASIERIVEAWKEPRAPSSAAEDAVPPPPPPPPARAEPAQPLNVRAPETSARRRDAAPGDGSVFAERSRAAPASQAAPRSSAPASNAPASNAPASNAPASNAPASNAPASNAPGASSAPPSAAAPASIPAGAPASTPATCTYCGTPRDASNAMCPTCFPQIRLE